MSAEENKQTVRRMFDLAFNAGDPSLIADVIDPNYVDHSPIPAPGSGPEAFAKRTAALRAAFVEQALFGVFLAEGDLVAFTWTFNGVHKGPFAGLSPTGKKVTLSGINIERFERGKIVEHWSHFDLAGLVKQIKDGA